MLSSFDMYVCDLEFDLSMTLSAKSSSGNGATDV